MKSQAHRNDPWEDPIPPWLDRLITFIIKGVVIFSILYFSIHFIIDIVWKG